MFTPIVKKNVLYTTRTNLEKRMFHVRTSILLKIGGLLQLVVVLVYEMNKTKTRQGFDQTFLSKVICLYRKKKIKVKV